MTGLPVKVSPGVRLPGVYADKSITRHPTAQACHARLYPNSFGGVIMTNTAQENIRFHFETRQIRVIQDSRGGLWFVAKDVCDVLEHSDPRKAVAALDEDEKGRRKVPTRGGRQEMWAVNESGLYTLIIRSNKPQAKPFRKWVTSVVLPAIRQTGCYGGMIQKRRIAANFEAPKAAAGIPVTDYGTYDRRPWETARRMHPELYEEIEARYARLRKDKHRGVEALRESIFFTTEEFGVLFDYLAIKTPRFVEAVLKLQLAALGHGIVMEELDKLYDLDKMPGM